MSKTNDLLLEPDILKDVPILVVDNDCDNQILYAFILVGYGAKVTAFGSIQEALRWLDGCTPAILICELRFLGENVDPLIYQVRLRALSINQAIPILVTSTCSLGILAQQWKFKVEAYCLKPVDVEQLVAEVWRLLMKSNIEPPIPIQSWLLQNELNPKLACVASIG
jgi:DNA-binding NtrC family response regulator